MLEPAELVYDQLVLPIRGEGLSNKQAFIVFNRQQRQLVKHRGHFGLVCNDSDLVISWKEVLSIDHQDSETFQHNLTRGVNALQRLVFSKVKSTVNEYVLVYLLFG